MHLRNIGIDRDRSIVAFERVPWPPHRVKRIAAIEVQLKIARFDFNSLVVTGDGVFETLEHGSKIQSSRCMIGHEPCCAAQQLFSFPKVAALCAQQTQEKQRIKVITLFVQNRSVELVSLCETPRPMGGNGLIEFCNVGRGRHYDLDSLGIDATCLIRQTPDDKD